MIKKLSLIILYLLLIQYIYSDKKNQTASKFIVLNKFLNNTQNRLFKIKPKFAD